jgi:iron(II)-dependent oxidoreductase
VTDTRAPELTGTVADLLSAARERTLSLTRLGDDDLMAQHSPLMSPLAWDMAHIANYEELWLVRALGGEPIGATHDRMYDAFENARADRPSLPLLGPDEARAYLRQVREASLDRLYDGLPPSGGVDPRLLTDQFVYGMVIQHEHMHDETMLATRQLMGSHSTPPPGATLSATASEAADRPVVGGEVEIPAGSFRIGVDRRHEPWAFDNESPAHERRVGPFAIDVTPVTNGAYRDFVEAGSYDDESVWCPAGPPVLGAPRPRVDDRAVRPDDRARPP